MHSHIDRKGFTLIEIFLAITLSGVIMIACLSSFTASFNYLRKAMELRAATLVLQEQISKVRELEFDDIKNLGSAFSSAIMVGLGNPTGSILKSTYGSSADILKVTLKIDWTSFDGRPMSKTIVTLITNHGIDKR